MRKLLNTLYITTPNAYLGKDGENIVIKVDDQEKFRVPVHNIESIITFGFQGASPSLMHLCAERKVGLSFHSSSGKFLCRVSGPVSGNVFLRRKQYRLADDHHSALNISRLFIAGKIANSRNIIQRAIRDHGSDQNITSLQRATRVLRIRQRQALRCSDPAGLRGIEGEAASTYFSVFNHMIVSQRSEFIMSGRSRRPPKDRVNALLSYIYTILTHEVQSALESVGLDPYVGFFHTDRPGRASLALDLVEELRAYLADRLALSLINRKQVKYTGFIDRDEGGVIMDDDTKKEVLSSWQKRKQDEIFHPFLEESVPLGLLPYCQALLLARYLRGDLDNYPVFLIK